MRHASNEDSCESYLLDVSFDSLSLVAIKLEYLPSQDLQDILCEVFQTVPPPPSVSSPSGATLLGQPRLLFDLVIK